MTSSVFVLLTWLSLHRCATIVVVLDWISWSLADGACSIMDTIVSTLSRRSSIFHETLEHLVARVLISEGALLAVILFTIVLFDGG